MSTTNTVGCTCNSNEGFAEVTANTLKYCCPIGSTITNGACVCDSTLATKVYVFSDGQRTMCATTTECTLANNATPATAAVNAKCTCN